MNDLPMDYLAAGTKQIVEATRLMFNGGDVKVKLPGRGIVRRIHIRSLGEIIQEEIAQFADCLAYLREQEEKRIELLRSTESRRP